MLVSKEERRRYARLPIDCPVSYKKPEDTKPRSGKGRNLSANGILFMADRMLPVGTPLEVNVFPTVSTLAPLSALARVVRCQPGQKMTECWVAVEIEQIIA